MEIHASEQEQVEALKKWWKENGTSLVSGLVIGLAVLFGGKAWFNHQERTAGNAAALYGQLMNAVDAGKDEDARRLADQVISGFSSTGYAPLSALALARIAVNNDELTAAQAHLQWVIDNADADAVKHVARQRLVRVLIALEKFADAGQLLDQAGNPEAYAYQYTALRGDLHKAQNQLLEAAQSYKSALSLMPAEAPEASLIRMQYERLAGLLPEADAQ